VWTTYKIASFLAVLLEISASFQWKKNFENQLRFDEVTAMSLVVASFSEEDCIHTLSPNLKIAGKPHIVSVIGAI